MAKISAKRARELIADKDVVMVLYRAACERFGKEKADRDLTTIWNMRCMWGMLGQLPFRGGMVSRNLGEVMHVAREVCGLGKRRG